MARGTGVTIEFNKEDITALSDYFNKLGPEFEKRTQKFMDRYRGHMADDIKSTFPISRYHPDGRHARTHKSLLDKRLFLGFYIRERNARTIGNWREYGYLIFPEEGRGYTNPTAQRFFERGVERHEPIIVERLKSILDRVIAKA